MHGGNFMSRGFYDLDMARHVNSTSSPIEWGDTALHKAAEEGHVDVVKSLFENGAEVNATNTWGDTALHKAAEEGHVVVVKSLFENGAEVNATNTWGNTALHMAAWRGHVDVVKYLVENGADVNATDMLGETALHKAAGAGHVDVVNATDMQGETALHKAVGGGRFDVVKYLVENGAEVNATDKLGETALHKAAGAGHVDVVKYLVENGADVNATDKWGRTALDMAAYGGHVDDVVKYLVENGADVNATDKRGETALHMAARRGHVDVVKCLVENGADVNATDKDGKVPLDLATARGHDLVIKYLVDERAKLDAIKEARSLALQFMSENPGCIRAVPYESSNEDTKPLTIRLYVDDDETGITDEFKDAAQKKFGHLYEIEYEDLLRPPLSTIIKTCEKHKKEELSSLSKIIEKHLHLFDNRLNVTAVCASYKVTDFIEEDTPCVTVFVLGKGRIPAGEKDINEIKRHCCPQFANTEFDVAVGYYRPTYGPSLESSNLVLRGGVGIGVRGARGAGTLGGFLEDEEGKLYILSNEHVLNSRAGMSHSDATMQNPSNKIIEQPARLNYDKIFKGVSDKHSYWSSEKSKIEKSRQDVDSPEYNDDWVKIVERNLRRAGNELDIIESEEPRRIGEYVCGLQDNVEGHFVDAAIAVLDEKESKNIKSYKHSKDKEGRCPIYGFENDDCFHANGEIVDMADFVSGITQGQKFMKFGKTTNFTDNGSVETGFEMLFIKRSSQTPNVEQPSGLTHVQFAFCEDCIQSFPGDTEKYHKKKCGSCSKQLSENDPVRCFWALNCLVIRKPAQLFSDSGDSGALVFGNDGRAWALVFGKFFHPRRDSIMCVASPLSMALKALEMKFGKKFKLWCTKEKGKDSGEGEKCEDEEEKGENEESEQVEVGAENGASKEVIEEYEEIEETGVSEEKGVNNGNDENNENEEEKGRKQVSNVLKRKEETQLEHITKLKRVNDNLKTMEIGK